MFDIGLVFKVDPFYVRIYCKVNPYDDGGLYDAPALRALMHQGLAPDIEEINNNFYAKVPTDYNMTITEIQQLADQQQIKVTKIMTEFRNARALHRACKEVDDVFK